MRLMAFPVIAGLVVSSMPAGALASKPASPITGQWVSKCLPLGKNGRHGLIVRLNISASTFDASGQMYGRNSCDLPVLSFVDQARVKRTKRVGGNWQLDTRFLSATTTIQAKEVAAPYAAGTKCGLTGWQVGVPMHVEGRTCEPMSFPVAGTNLLVKARLAGDRLTLQDASKLLGASAGEGVVLPQDIEFERAAEGAR